MGVGLGEVDGLGALGGGGHTGDDEVDLAGLEGGDEAIEGVTLQLEGAAEFFGEFLGHADIDAIGLAFFVFEFKGRIGHVHADDEGIAGAFGGSGGFPAATESGTGEEGQEQSSFFHRGEKRRGI